MLKKLLGICPGVTAVIGGGGKTTLLRTLGQELSERNSVLLCTTTKMFPFADIPYAGTAEQLWELRGRHQLLCAGRGLPDTHGKITAPDVPMEQLAKCFDYVLVEADGSAGRPMKAHASHEPVVPPEAHQTIYVVGASGFGKPVKEAAHRPEIYARLAGVEETAVITPETEAAVLKAEMLHDRVYVNQVETLVDLAEAKVLAALLREPVLAGSLKRGEYFQCS